MTRASGGKGIVLATSLRSIVNAPLYTKQLAIKGEYRVHVFNGEVIDYQKKRKREEAIENGDIAEDIRNINNGWVYSIRATRALGLNFGAVDIIRDINRRSYILEVNTAPGLEGLTLVNYTNAIRKSLDEMDKARNSWNVNQQRFS
jgi:glutathione synthase/RimK-type ligase-like ATP-grasp enzyme